MPSVFWNWRIGLLATMTVATAIALMSIIFAGGQTGPGVGDGGKSRPKERELRDIDGTSHRPFDDPEVRAVLLVFVVPDCPIANSYMPEFNRLYADYGPRGVRLFLIQVDPQLSIEGAANMPAIISFDLPSSWTSAMPGCGRWAPRLRRKRPCSHPRGICSTSAVSITATLNSASGEIRSPRTTSATHWTLSWPAARFLSQEIRPWGAASRTFPN